MVRTLCYPVLIALLVVSTLLAPTRAQVFSEPDPNEPAHIRGQITEVNGGSITVDTGNGEPLRLAVQDNLTVIGLSKGSFTKVDFGVYVGSVSIQLDKYSPIVRDSLSWLHQGFELRIVDEALRGIAVGHKHWDLAPESVMAHGWVDDIEGRVISIKYGPTEEEETDVEVSRDIPVLTMALADQSLIKPDAHIFAGAQKNGNGEYVALFMFVGHDGIVPPL